MKRAVFLGIIALFLILFIQPASADADNNTVLIEVDFSASPASGNAPLDTILTPDVNRAIPMEFRWDYYDNGTFTTVEKSQTGSRNVPDQLLTPRGIATDGTYLFIADTGNERLLRLRASDFGFENRNGSYGTGTTGNLFRTPYGLALNASTGYIFTTETTNNRVQTHQFNITLSLDFRFITRKGGTSAGTGIDQFSAPNDICDGMDGYVYVVDTSNTRVVKRFANNLTFVAFNQSPLTTGLRGCVVHGANISLVENHRIREFFKETLTATGRVYGTTASGSTDYTMNTPTGVTTDGAYLYIINSAAGQIRKISLTTYNYTAKAGSVGTGTGQLSNSASHLVYNPADSLLYISDTGNNRINVWTTALAYSKQYNPTLAATPIRDLFNSPQAVSVRNGMVAVADTSWHRVHTYYQNLTRINSSAYNTSNTGNGRFNTPRGVAISTDGQYLFVSDSSNHRLQKLDLSTFQYMTKIGGTAAGTGQNQFNTPYGISCDDTLVYVADASNHRIKSHLVSDLSFYANTTSTTAGSGDGRFNSPRDAYVYGDFIYVPEVGNDRVQVLHRLNLTYYQKYGTVGTGNDQLTNPEGVCADGTYLYVMDTGNNRIVKRWLNNLSYVSAAGTRNTGTSENGIYNPSSCNVKDGILYVSDRANHRIVRFHASNLTYYIPQVSHTYPSPGLFSVKLTVRGLFDAFAQKSDYINVSAGGAPPIVDFAANTTAGVAPLAVLFNDTSTGAPPTSWTWDVEDDSVPDYTTQNITHTYTQFGNYSVTLTAANAYGSNSTTKINYITVGEEVAADFTANQTSGVQPLPVQFTDTSTGNVTSWDWDFGDGNTSTSQNPAYTYVDSGTYTISLTATNAGGNDTETKTDYITVDVAPPAAEFTANTTSGTAPLDIEFTDQSTNSPTSWDWDFGDGNTSTSQNPIYTYVGAGTYTVSLTATNAGGSNTEIKTDYITVSLAPVPPTAQFTANTTSGTVPLVVLFTDQSTNTPTSWTWDFGDGNTSAQQNPNNTYATAGTYTVSLTATNIAGNETETKTV